MKYYHGTTSDAADAIDSEGFAGSELSSQTDGFTTNIGEGVVFVAATVDHAAEYGEVVYEIELLNGSPVFFNTDAMGRKEYYIPLQAMKDDGIWSRLP